MATDRIEAKKQAEVYFKEKFEEKFKSQLKEFVDQVSGQLKQMEAQIITINESHQEEIKKYQSKIKALN